MAYLYEEENNRIICKKCKQSAGFYIRYLNECTFGYKEDGDVIGEECGDIKGNTQLAYCSWCGHRLGNVHEILERLGKEEL